MACFRRAVDATRDDLTIISFALHLSIVKVSWLKFQREFTQMKAAAAAGETVKIVSKGEEFIFQAAPKRTWQGALKGKGEVKGDLFGTGIRWNVSE